MNNVRRMRNVIKSLNKGDTIYINTINCTVSMIEQLKRYIKDGVLFVDENELCKVVVIESIDKFRKGEAIVPQMTYIKA